MKYMFGLDLDKFFLSMVLGFIVILGVAGFILIEINSKYGIVTASITSDTNIIEETMEETPSNIALANKIWGYRQKMWIADNPVIRTGRQIVYLTVFYLSEGEDFPEKYQQFNRGKVEEKPH